ncbi:MAG TPA: hypothetical protein VM686_31790 [Polyangiaceae bacterium]|nr:hypothetical protein [Polyangiaceae bacterium]
MIGLVLPTIASAATDTKAETRVWGFDLIAQTLVGPSSPRSLEKHLEIPDAYAKVASGSPLAAEGLGGMGGGGGRSIVVTENVIREAMKDAPLMSQQAGGVSLPRIQANVNKLLAGEVAPAIKVDGKMIVDGNHRYIAGRIFGREPDGPSEHGRGRAALRRPDVLRGTILPSSSTAGQPVDIQLNCCELPTGER